MPEKITGKTEDRAKLNFEQLLEFVAEKFPSCVIEKQTEEKNEDTGATEIRYERAINWQALGNLVGTELSEEQGSARRELFGFAWSGKNEAAREANRVIDMTLRPCPEESLDWDNTGNLYIEGDNLQALKMLQGSYLGKVKMIYIDPPYNTGNEFVYNDDFCQSQEDYVKESGEIDEVSGARLVSKAFTLNADTSPRYHSKWCSMMYSRLLLARDLLRRDGVIFISIDDHEQHHLRDICDEIFGERNFVAQFVWQRNPSPKNDNKYVAVSHEYILMYARAIELFDIGRLPFSEEGKERDYSNPDNDPRGIWTSGPITSSYNEEYNYPITTPSGKVYYPTEGTSWRYPKDGFAELVADNRIYFGKNGSSRPRIKRFFSELLNNTTVPRSLLLWQEVGKTQDGSGALKKVEMGGVFISPKPVRLLRHLLTLANLASQSGEIVLDFFSGSATTAEAVMRANAEDGGNRHFILVQLPEACKENTPASQAGYRNICEIGKERIRRVANAITSQSNCTKIVQGGGTMMMSTVPRN